MLRLGRRRVDQPPGFQIRHFSKNWVIRPKIAFSNLRKKCKKINFLIKEKSSRALLGDRLRDQANVSCTKETKTAKQHEMTGKYLNWYTCTQKLGFNEKLSKLMTTFFPCKSDQPLLFTLYPGHPDPGLTHQFHRAAKICWGSGLRACLADVGPYCACLSVCMEISDLLYVLQRAPSQLKFRSQTQLSNLWFTSFWRA